MTRFINWFFYSINVAWVKLLVLIVASRDVEGLQNVPHKGALIITCNHLNNADPPVIGSTIPRQIAWLTKKEWFSTPVVGTLFKLSGMIPVRRFDADLHALREVQQLLTRGGCLGMFPEGTRSRDKKLNRGEPGSALVALRSGARVLPVAIWGTEDVKLPLGLIGRHRVHLRIGKPYRLEGSTRPSREEVNRGTERIMREIAALLPERYRGVYVEPPVTTASEKYAANP